MADGRQALGRSGEDRAAAWYEARGWVVVARNWRCREGELDLVLRRRDEVAVCEVKARTTDAFGTPLDAVTATKQRRVRMLATRWLADARPGAVTVRFDVAAVRGDEVEVVEAAF